MKRNYKVKEKNITKLKSYLQDGIKRINKGLSRSFNNKHNSSKRSDIQ